MAEILLNRSRIVAVIGELASGRVTKHVRMNTGNSNLATSPALVMSLRTAESVSGAFRPVTKT